ncbi:MAG: polyribonucleotide nucleotidyltransferase [Chloroflexia bacterium]
MEIPCGERTFHRFEMPLAGRTLTIEIGRVAEQANGSALVRCGETVILATATASAEPRAGVDFFPLTVDFEEKLYAAGKIPGSFFRREGRPTEAATLAARLIDRSLRPLFPKAYHNDVQIIITVLAVDQEVAPDVLGIIGASTALMVSDIPFDGPVAAVRMGLIGDELVVNPTLAQVEEESALDLVVAGTEDAILMVEGRARQVPEARVLEALRRAHEAMQPLLQMQHEIAARLGQPKQAVAEKKISPEKVEEIRAWLGPRLSEALFHGVKQEREDATRLLREETVAYFGRGETEAEALQNALEAGDIFDRLLKEELRRSILEEGRRPDGRGPKDIRPLSIEVGVLPRVHGSALFRRGQTQVLTVVTLGAPGDEQILDDLGLAESKRYMHHYNFPPFSTGEVRPLRGPHRRDIGHGALAERALLAVLPGEEEFPYTIRLVSEVLSSNGSSSMASVCGSSLALMDAGVPIRAQVAGVALGLITGEDGRYAILTDIQGVEDFLGDMDLKIAGTEQGITALQMDLKVHGLSFEVLAQAFDQAREGRLYILQAMNAVIRQPRAELSPYAPRIVKMRIDPEKIGAVIGPGGKTIRSIIEASGAEIDVEDDGSVYITTPNAEGARIAVRMIEQLAREPKVGDVYLGKVVRIMPYGAFVNILPNRDGMVHISELDENRVARVEDVVQVGDEINVMITQIDPDGKISLSRRAVLTGEKPDRAAARKQAWSPGGAGRRRERELERRRPPRRPGR